jgi:hypothetical protein
VAGEHARFVPRTGETVLIEHVFRVSMGWKESTYRQPMLPIVDTYIEVLYGDRRNRWSPSSTMAAGSGWRPTSRIGGCSTPSDHS